jgi:ADP-ribosylglycohydrolase
MNSSASVTKVALPLDYRERVYAGWLGKCIGVCLGAPVEGWTYQAILDNLGEIRHFLPLPPGKTFKPDDDTAMPLVLIRALEDYGAEVTADQMGQIWLNYLGDQHGTLWWGGYGVSTEHTAYLNLAGGIPAPLSGSIKINGAALAEQIGGQIFSDIWGLVIPNDPSQAAELAERASRVSHDGNGIYGGRYIAALTSLAFGEQDPRVLVERALAVIPAESEYARVVWSVCDFYRQHPGDWQQAYRFLFDNFGYDRYPGMVHIIPNAGVVVMALLYGEGNFTRTVQIATNAGWDTDCNAGNVGAIMGVAVGLEGLDPAWREPMNDRLVGASLIGARNLTDIATCADLFVRLGRRIAGLPETPRPSRYHFDLPGSTQGFECQVDENRGSHVGLRQVAMPEGGALQSAWKKLNKKGEARLFVRTWLRLGDLSSNFYGAAFSPQLYPGQTLRARVHNPAGQAPLHAALYALDENTGRKIQGTLEPVQPGDWRDLFLRIPPMNSALISQAGVVLRNLGDEVWSGTFWLDDLDWDGAPNYSDDFRYAHPEVGTISQWTYLRGYWRLQDGAYHGSGPDLNESYTGDIAWKDLTYRVRLVPLAGDHHNINVRVQGALRSYALGLATGDRLALYKNIGGRCYREIASAAFPWVHGQAYFLWVEAMGNRLRAGASDKTLIDWQDGDAPYLYGQVGLSNFPGCHTRFEEVWIG